MPLKCFVEVFYVDIYILKYKYTENEMCVGHKSVKFTSCHVCPSLQFGNAHISASMRTPG